MIRTVHLARPRGYCAGVVTAIEAVERTADAMRARGEGDLTVVHAIVHNRTVVDRLTRARGVRFVEDLADRSASHTVVFSAHGVPPAVREQADRLGLATVDATCPLVTKVHTEARKYAALGYTILLIADSTDHQEVIGTVGEAPDATVLVAVGGGEERAPGLVDPDEVDVPDPARVVALTQTTLNVDRTVRTIERLRARFPALVVPSRDDLCYATKNRQDAVRRIGSHVQLFLVVSSDTSSNGARLVEVAREVCGRARRIDSAAELDPAWFEGVEAVGVTSAASTPEDLVQDVVAYFRRDNPDLEVVEEGEPEDITFRLPKRVPPAGKPR